MLLMVFEYMRHHHNANNVNERSCEPMISRARTGIRQHAFRDTGVFLERSFHSSMRG